MTITIISLGAGAQKLINSNIAQPSLTDRKKDTQNASFVGAHTKAKALCRGSEAARQWDRGKPARKHE